ncbi:MAG TPA: DNA-binding protein WhiA [Candidatus Dormibacteraeota bacterium]
MTGWAAVTRLGCGGPGGGVHREEGPTSFAAEVKAELAGLTPARPCCQVSELLGIFFSSRGRLIRSGTGQAAYFPLLRNTVARKVVRLARIMGGLEAQYQAVRSAKQMAFFIELPLPAGLDEMFSQPAARALPDQTCDRKAMLRGFFLGCGSVNAPSGRYHLEMVVPTLGWATGLLKLLHDAGIRAGMMERAGHHVVYLKEGDAIVRALGLIGASRAVMEFEKVRVVREVSGQVNRRLNFETANIDKTIGSAMRQVAAIDKLRTAGRLETMPPALQEMARARKANPELNLTELADRMKLSKSAINHRLRRLVETADALPDGNEAETQRSA